jgi:hypothetical protein
MVVEGHHIDVSRLRTDDFDGYFSARRQALLALIGMAMGKEVADVAVPVPAAAEAYDLEDEELGQLPFDGRPPSAQ